MNVCVESAAPAVGSLVQGIMSVGPMKEPKNRDGVNTPTTNASRPLSPNANYLESPSFVTNVSTPNTKISDPIFTESEDSCAGQAFDSKDFVISLTVDVAIVGAEHAGLAAAIAIHTRTGSVVHAFAQDEIPENNSCVSENFSKDAANPNTAKAERHSHNKNSLEMISLTDRVLDALYCIDAGLYDDIMEQVTHTPNASQKPSPVGDSSLQISSTDLMKSLQKCARGHAGIKIHPKNQVLHVHPVREHEKAEGLALHFEDGTKVLARMVVAADGINSTIRQIVEANCVTGETESRVHYFGSSVIPECECLGAGVWAASEGKKHQASFRVSPESRTVMWTLTEQRHELGSECFEATPEASKQRVCAILEAMASNKATNNVDLPGLRRVIENTPLGNIQSRIHSRPFVPAEKWTHHDSQLVLLGDAAHPLSRCLSNGFDLAVEDAVQLACCLSDSGKSRQCALKRFECARRKCLEPLFRYNDALNACVSAPDKCASNICVCENVGQDFYTSTFFAVHDSPEGKWQAALIENTENETEYM